MLDNITRRLKINTEEHEAAFLIKKGKLANYHMNRVL